MSVHINFKAGEQVFQELYFFLSTRHLGNLYNQYPCMKYVFFIIIIIEN